ncbi:MAG: WD40 repeat domain-containing protein [Microthrixaceae bacterium]
MSNDEDEMARRQSADEAGRRDGTALTVGVVRGGDDAAIGSLLEDRFRAAGAVVDTGSASEADVRVILLSEALIRTPDWLELVGPFAAERLVPVLVGPLSTEALPTKLTELNWVIWDTTAVESSIGKVFAAVTTSPSDLELRQLIRRQALAWAVDGNAKDLLSDDRDRVREARRLIGSAPDVTTSSYTDVVSAFVDQSIARLRTRRRRRMVLGLLLIAAIVAAVGVFAVAFSYATVSRQNNRAAITSTGAGLEQMSAWSALNAASTMTSAQQDAEFRSAYDAALEAVQERWPVGDIVVGGGYAVDAVQPLGDGSTSVAAVGADRGGELRFVVTRTSEVTWSVPLPERAVALAIDRGERFAAVATTSLVLVIDTGDTSIVARHELPGIERVAIDRKGTVLGATSGGDLILIDGTDDPRLVAHADQFLDVSSDETDRLQAVGFFDGGRYVIVDGASGAERASGTVKAPVIAAAGLSPSGNVAVVTAGDLQLWQIGVDGNAPTGIAVPDRTTALRPIDDTLVAFGGQEEYVRIVHLPTGGELANRCRQVFSTYDLSVSPSGQALACVGPLSNEVFRVDDRPVMVDQIVWEGPGTTSANGIVAFSPQRRQLTAGADGDVTVAERDQGGEVATVARWAGPDLAVTGLGWLDDQPYVRTTGGWAWPVHDCPGCSDPDALVDTVRERLPGCWVESQLENIPAGSRRHLDVPACP